MTDPINVLTTLTPADWTALLGFLGVGGANSVVTKVIVHLRQEKWLNHPTAMARFVVVAVCVITAAMQYVVGGGSNLTVARVVTLIVEHAAWLLAIAHFWFWLTVQPAYKYFLGLLEDAAKWRASTAPQPTAGAAGVVQPGQTEV